MKFTGFRKRAFHKIVTFVKQYDREDRCYHSYDKFFEEGGLIWKLCGTASRHLPSPRKDLKYDDIRKVKKSETKCEQVLAFLDRYFSFGDIDLPGDSEHKRYTRLPWIMVYEKYLEHCIQLKLEPAKYNCFCSIR